jgi:hypothetical protein
MAFMCDAARVWKRSSHPRCSCPQQDTQCESRGIRAESVSARGMEAARSGVRPLLLRFGGARQPGDLVGPWGLGAWVKVRACGGRRMGRRARWKRQA